MHEYSDNNFYRISTMRYTGFTRSKQETFRRLPVIDAQNVKGTEKYPDPGITLNYD